MSLLSASAKEAPPLQASKWLKAQVLLDVSEMEMLLSELKEEVFYQVSQPCPNGLEKVDPKVFLQLYQKYIEALKEGGILPDAEIRSLFSLAMTKETDALRAIPVDANRLLVRAIQPVIQMQPHRMDYSLPDRKFHTMVYGIDSISWGVQFSFPQIYQDPVNKEIHITKDSANGLLFKQLQKWIRHHTIPVPFLLLGEKMHIPVRIGKECLPWIHAHPDLKRKHLQVLN